MPNTATDCQKTATDCYRIPRPQTVTGCQTIPDRHKIPHTARYCNRLKNCQRLLHMLSQIATGGQRLPETARDCHKFHRLPKNTIQCQILQQTAKDSHRLSHTATDCLRLPQTATHCHRITQTTTEYHRIPHTARYCHRLPRNAKNCNTLPLTAADCHRLPQTNTDCHRRPQTAPVLSEMLKSKGLNEIHHIYVPMM